MVNDIHTMQLPVTFLHKQYVPFAPVIAVCSWSVDSGLLSVLDFQRKDPHFRVLSLFFSDLMSQVMCPLFAAPSVRRRFPSTTAVSVSASPDLFWSSVCVCFHVLEESLRSNSSASNNTYVLHGFWSQPALHHKEVRTQQEMQARPHRTDLKAERVSGTTCARQASLSPSFFVGRGMRTSSEVTSEHRGTRSQCNQATETRKTTGV